MVLGKAQMEPRELELRVGTVIDGYVLIRQLGAGGMGVVFEAYEAISGRNVALKFFHPWCNAQICASPTHECDPDQVGYGSRTSVHAHCMAWEMRPLHCERCVGLRNSLGAIGRPRARSCYD